MTSQIEWARYLPLLGLAVAAACADPHPEGRHSSIHVSTNGGLA